MCQHSVDVLHLLPIILTKTPGLRKVSNLPAAGRETLPFKKIFFFYFQSSAVLER